MTREDHSTTLYLCLYVTGKMSLRKWLEQITQPLCICVCVWLAKCLYGNDWNRSLNHSVSVSVCDWQNVFTGMTGSRSLNHSVSVSVCDWQNVFTGMTGADHSTTLCLCLYVWPIKCIYGNDWSRSLNHSVSVSVCDYKMSLREWLEQITQPLCICVCMWLTKCLYGNDWSRSLNHSVSVSVCDLQNVFTGMTGADNSTTLYLCLYLYLSLREWLGVDHSTTL